MHSFLLFISSLLAYKIFLIILFWLLFTRRVLPLIFSSARTVSLLEKFAANWVDSCLLPILKNMCQELLCSISQISVEALTRKLRRVERKTSAKFVWVLSRFNWALLWVHKLAGSVRRGWEQCVWVSMIISSAHLCWAESWFGNDT